MDQKQVEATIKNTEEKLEVLEGARRELQEKVEKKRTEVALFKRMVQATQKLDEQSSK